MIGRAVLRAAVAALVLVVFVLDGSASAATLQQQLSWGGPASDAAQGTAIAPDGSTYLPGTPPASARTARPPCS
jgi:hypothetical protein